MSDRQCVLTRPGPDSLGGPQFLIVTKVMSEDGSIDLSIRWTDNWRAATQFDWDSREIDLLRKLIENVQQIYPDIGYSEEIYRRRVAPLRSKDNED